MELKNNLMFVAEPASPDALASANENYFKSFGDLLGFERPDPSDRGLLSPISLIKKQAPPAKATIGANKAAPPPPPKQANKPPPPPPKQVYQIHYY